jgi:hypothetical protein
MCPAHQPVNSPEPSLPAPARSTQENSLPALPPSVKSVTRRERSLLLCLPSACPQPAGAGHKDQVYYTPAPLSNPPPTVSRQVSPASPLASSPLRSGHRHAAPARPNHPPGCSALAHNSPPGHHAGRYDRFPQVPGPPLNPGTRAYSTPLTPSCQVSDPGNSRTTPSPPWPPISAPAPPAWTTSLATRLPCHPCQGAPRLASLPLNQPGLPILPHPASLVKTPKRDSDISC